MSFKFPKINHEDIKKRFKENLDGKSSQSKDDRFYVLTKPEQGKAEGASVIRWLPGKVVNGKQQLNYASLFRHHLQINVNGKKGPVLSCICPTTIGEKCPICEWNRSCEDGFANANNFYPFRKPKYISNILVIEEDKAELKNQVMLFEYGKQIMSILESNLYPKQIGTRKKQPLLYYDWDTGANFDLVLVHPKGDYPHWKESEFLAPSSIMDIVNERGLDPEELVESLYDLEEIVKNLKIPSYGELQTELYGWITANNLEGGNSMETNLENENRAHRLQEKKKSKLATAVEQMNKEEMENAGTEEDLDEVADRSNKKSKAIEPVDEEKKEKKFKDFKSFMSKKKEEDE